jgi:hypothetical protein
MAAHELSVGALDIPPRGSYQQRGLERALRSLEFEIEFVNAQLEAATTKRATTSGACSTRRCVR